MLRFLISCPIWHIRENRPLQKDATRHAVIFHYRMPHSDNFSKFEMFELFRPHVCKMSVFKSEFIMPTYQPTAITMRISINSTLFSLSIAICGGMRVHFMKDSAFYKANFWAPSAPWEKHFRRTCVFFYKVNFRAPSAPWEKHFRKNVLVFLQG